MAGATCGRGSAFVAFAQPTPGRTHAWWPCRGSPPVITWRQRLLKPLIIRLTVLVRAQAVQQWVRDMKDDVDMSRHLRSFYARSNVIFRKFIKTYCAPYCSQLWVNHSKCSYNKPCVAYNNAYRRVVGYVKSDTASNMFVFNRVENYDAHNRHLSMI